MKTILLFLMLVCSAFAQADFSPEWIGTLTLQASGTSNSLTTGLVDEWKLDESSGNASDSVGGFTLTNQGSATFVSGKINNAVSNLAASSQMLYVSNTSLSGTITNISMTGWIHRGSSANNVAFGFGSTSTNRFNILWFSDGNLYIQIAKGGTTYSSTALSGTGWHHVAVVYDGTQSTDASRVLCYIDGVKKTLTFTGTSPSSYTVAPVFYVGRDTANGYSTGLFDCVLLYNIPISSNVVTSLYNAGNGVQP